MPYPSLVRWLCNLYAVLLYSYPRQFRLQYGCEMQQVFRDRCLHVARKGGRLRLLRFSIHSGADWLTTTVREGMDALPPGNRLLQMARSFWSSGWQEKPRGFIAEWVMTILVYLFATTTLVQAYVVPTGSMEGTVRVGDHMLVDRLTFSDPGSIGRHLLPYREIQRGDIVAFTYPEDIRQTYVKRVIGLPGDRIRMHNQQVIRNGHALTEPYTQHLKVLPDDYRDNFPNEPDSLVTPRGIDMLQHHVRHGEVIVPPGALFVMGDNRENSADSRYWGFVPRPFVVGKPLVVYWSYDAPTSELQEWSINHVVDVALHFFTKTRWDRALLVPKSQQAIEAGGAQ